ncbi:hypothetical protein DFH09DRAFT_1083031 [Mycena vulgaris]|nr:hypothetical protein DFH09DRAFT_1083031 [Mycena vulgaris]
MFLSFTSLALLHRWLGPVTSLLILLVIYQADVGGTRSEGSGPGTEPETGRPEHSENKFHANWQPPMSQSWCPGIPTWCFGQHKFWIANDLVKQETPLILHYFKHNMFIVDFAAKAVETDEAQLASVIVFQNVYERGLLEVMGNGCIIQAL